MKLIYCFLTLTLLLVSQCHPAEIKEIDSNMDGKTDKWFYTQEGNLIKMEEDLDYDTIVDKTARFYYKDGEKTKVEIDSNMDGEPDGLSFHKNGFRYRIESDTNYDGKTDYLIDNLKNITTVDSNYDGIMDIRKTVQYIGIDSNHNGTMDQAITTDIELEQWLQEHRPEFFRHLKQYMRNTNYKR